MNILEKKQNINGFKRIRAELKEVEHDLGERIKELNCLYGISQLAERPEVSFEDIIHGTLELIPPAWQFPEVTCGRITYDTKLYKTENFKETEWKLTTRIGINEKPMEIEVYYLEDNPFLKEEINLITDIGKRLKVIFERMEAEQKLRASEHDLGERVKELNCLYGISKLVERSEISFEKIIHGTLELIPPAWQFPEVTCARITYDKKIYKTENFKETEWKLITRIGINEKPMEIEVYYLEDKPFLKEEINLINDIGKRLKIILEQMEAKQKLKESEEKLKKLNLELERRIEERTKDLKESEQRYRELYEDAPNAYFTVKPDKSIKSCNQAAVELLGYYKEEFQNMKVFDLYYKSPEGLQTSKRLFKKFLEGKNVQDVELQMKHKNGNPIWVSLTVKPVRNQKGQVVESRSMVINITERMKMEEKLRNNEELFRDFFDSAAIGFHIFGPDRIITKMNEYELNLLGYSLEEIVDKKTWYDLIIPEQRNQFEKHWNDILDKGSVNNLEYTLIHKDGHFIDVLLNASSRFDDKNNLINTRGSVLNITERKKTKELIIEENKKLAELNKIKKNLIIRVSHELKTPLNSIYSAIHILMNFYRDRMDKEILEFNKIIYKGCVRLKKLIEDLIDISKLDHSKIILKKKKENIINTLKSCASEINHMATQRNLNIIIDLPKVLFIDFDKIRIEQVFINILSNAIKFTPPNGSIFIYLKENYKNIEISVKDTGIGLTKDEMKHLFKRFGKIERYGKQMEVDIEGSGLGLYIAKQIIELHGGDIIVESDGRNKGSTFTIRLNK